MEFWAGLGIGVASALVAGVLAIVGVMLTNRAAQNRDRVAQAREDAGKRANREHELRNSLVDLTKAIRRVEAKVWRGSITASEIHLEEEIAQVIWRVSRLNGDYRQSLVKEFDRAEAQLQVGLLEDGFARFEELIGALTEWATSSVRALVIPPDQRVVPTNFSERVRNVGMQEPGDASG